MTSKYVTAILNNNGTTKFALKGGNAQSGNLTTLYEGKLPNGYSPMVKQGAIVLGSGGDCCKPGGGANLSAGTFYEGAIVAGYPSNRTDSLVQSNIVASGYGSDITAIGSSASPSDNTETIQSSAIKMNCSNSLLQIEFTAPGSGITSLKIFDLRGNLVNVTELQTRSGSIYSHRFDLANMHHGFYIVKIDNGRSSIYKSKFLVTR